MRISNPSGESAKVVGEGHKALTSKASLWSVCVWLLCLVLALPIIVIFASIFFPSEDVWQHLIDTVLGIYISNSLLLMTGVSIGVLSVGILPAWLVTFYRFPGRSILEWALLMPLAIPAYIIAYTYTGLLDVAGPLQSLLRESFDMRYGDYWFPEVRSLLGAIVMLSLVFYPYVYLLARAAFLEQSASALEAARSLGCSPFRAFTQVGLPLARPAIVVGLSIALMETLADYGTVQYFGIPTFTTGIYRTFNGLGSSVGATQLAALLMVFVLSLLLLEGYSRRKSAVFEAVYRRPASRERLRGSRLVLCYFVCVAPIVFGFVIPFGQLAAWALLTFENIFNASFFQLSLNSLILAFLTAFFALMLALFVTYAKRLFGGFLNETAIKILSLGYAIPGVVIGLGVLIPFAWLDNEISTFTLKNFNFNMGLILSGSIFILIFAYLVRFLPIAINSVDSGLAKIKPSMDEAGRSMGRSPLTMLRKIHIPILRGSLLTAVLLVFVDVLKELPATLLLRPFNFNTLAVRTYELANEERLAEAAVPALTIVLVSIIPVILLSKSMSKSNYKNDEIIRA
jgi:iron(III) transport system permease protein